MAPKKAETKRTDGEGPKVYLKVDVSWPRPLLVWALIASDHWTVLVEGFAC